MSRVVRLNLHVWQAPHLWMIIIATLLQTFTFNDHGGIAFLFWGAGGGGGGEESLVSTVCACASFSQKSGYFRYTIVIINGRGCTTSTMLHASYSFTRAPLLLLFVSPWRETWHFRRRNNTHCCQGSLRWEGCLFVYQTGYRKICSTRLSPS